ncbi:ABC transporter ATP-binding protein [Staphylococcus aureus]|nr:ABC transporter ATP-binding protein [Staphylococcus aureus]
MGPSGSGKTTLLNVLSSIDQISSGSVIANGQELNKLNQKALAKFRKESLGFIFQDYSILPTLTVKENIMLPLSVQKMSKATMEENYKAITTALGIYDLGNKYPSELSGGQQQRTAAARAFVHKPQIIFADEPTGALDSKSANDLLQRLEEMNKSFDTTIVMVTHDPVAASFAERVIFLMYANHLFVKRRTREFALFQLIGLTRQNILKMLALEQMLSLLQFFVVDHQIIR